MRQREQRHPVLLPVRIRWNGRWIAASIRDISTRGLMLRTVTPPPPGSYVEIQFNSGSITARSVWVIDQSCGLRTQDRLDVDALRGSRGGSAHIRPSAAVAEARSQVRRPIVRSAQDQAARSERFSSLFQFVMIVAVSIGGSGSLGWEAWQILSAPFAKIQDKMQ